MNILDPSYFTDDEQRRVVGNLKESLVEGGVLAIGSNQGPGTVVEGAIYRVEGGKLVRKLTSSSGPRYHDDTQP